MKTKLVLWGKIAEEQRVLAAIELKAEDNRVVTYIFPQEIVTDEFVETMMEKWRNNKEVEFPEGYQHSEVPLSVTEPIIPVELVLERADLLTMAQSEWHVIVLSAKLHEVYKNELSDIRDKISQLEKYDSKLWEQLKGFWDRVREQIKDQNLFKEQADELQAGVNASFDALKKLRAKIEEEFQVRSQSAKAQFMEKLQQLEGQITEGSRLGMVFDELKKLQQKFRDVKFTKEDRAQVWEKLDGAFKSAKGKRYGGDAGNASSGGEDNNSAEGRFDRRLSGLEQAMDRMMKSMDRDNEDLAFQMKKIATTDGQLEAQIRQAKVKMIEERIRSKQERLDDMEKTKAEILKQIEKQKQRDAKRAERDRIEEAKKEAQAKIEEKMAQDAAKLDTQKLEKAAEIIQKDKEAAIKASASFEEMASDLSDRLTDTFEDAVDTLKATAMVIGAKVKEAMAGATDKVTEVIEEAEQAAENRISKDLAEAEIARAADEAIDVVDSISDAIEEATEENGDEKKE